jgi:hypothetical protein
MATFLKAVGFKMYSQQRTVCIRDGHNIQQWFSQYYFVDMCGEKRHQDDDDDDIIIIIIIVLVYYANKHEGIQQKTAALHFNKFFSHVYHS